MKLLHGRLPEKENEAVVVTGINKYKTGDLLDETVIVRDRHEFYTDEVSYRTKIKIVGILENKLSYYENIDSLYNIYYDKIFVKGDEGLRSLSNSKAVIVCYKSGLSSTRNEDIEMYRSLGLNSKDFMFNRDIKRPVSISNINPMNNPRYRMMVINSILFSTSLMIVYSRKRKDELRLLRMVGASKKQVLITLIVESIIIVLSSFILSNFVGIAAGRVLIDNINFSYIDIHIFEAMKKSIHYDPMFILYSLLPSCIPIFIYIIYQIFLVNTGSALHRGSNIFVDILNSILRFEIPRSRSALDRTDLIKKSSRLNLKKNLIYFIVPMYVMAISISHYITQLNMKNDSAGIFPVESIFYGRQYMMDREKYYSEKYGFDREDIKYLDDLEGVKNTMAMARQDVEVVIDRPMFSDKYLENLKKDAYIKHDLGKKDRNLSNLTGIGGLVEYSLVSIEGYDIDSLLYDKTKKRDDIPVIYLRDKFITREKLGYRDIYKGIKSGDTIKLKVNTMDDSGNLNRKTIDVEIGGFLDAKKLGNKMRNIWVDGMIYTDIENYEKIAGKIRFSNIYFDFDGDEDHLKKYLSDGVKNEFNFENISRRKEAYGDKKFLVEIYINLAYSIVISAVVTFVTAKIISSMRIDEDIIAICYGASIKRVRKMYIIEGIKYGLMGAVLTAILFLYNIVDMYNKLSQNIEDIHIFIDKSVIIVYAPISFIILSLSYIIATRIREDSINRHM